METRCFSREGEVVLRGQTTLKLHQPRIMSPSGSMCVLNPRRGLFYLLTSLRWTAARRLECCWSSCWEEGQAANHYWLLKGVM